MKIVGENHPPQLIIDKHAIIIYNIRIFKERLS